MRTITDHQIDREDFRRLLRDAVDIGDFSDSRLCSLLARPDCPPRLLRNVARHVYAGADCFPGLLADLIVHAPDSSAQAVLLHNLLSEQGLVIVPGRGLQAFAELSHVQWARRFAEACGVSAFDSADHLAGEAHWRSAIRGPEGWLPAVAYFLLGQEGNFSRVSAAMLSCLQRRGMRSEDLVFFERHAVADTHHAEDALSLICDRADSIGVQLACIEAARQGAQRTLQQFR